MMKAATIAPAYAEVAVEAADAFEAHAAELLEIAELLRDEVEMAGELPLGFVKRVETLIARQQDALATLIASAAR